MAFPIRPDQQGSSLAVPLGIAAIVLLGIVAWLGAGEVVTPPVSTERTVPAAPVERSAPVERVAPPPAPETIPTPK